MSAVAVVALLGMACGQASDVEVAPIADGVGTAGDGARTASGADIGGVAPHYEDVAPVAVVWPDEVAPLGTGGDPIAGADGATVETLVSTIQAWAEREAGGDVAGLWVDKRGPVVAFTANVESLAAALRAEVHPAIGIASVAFGEHQLRALQDRIMAVERWTGEVTSGALTGSGVLTSTDRVSLDVYHPSPERLQQLSDDYGADAICFEVQDPAPPPADGVTTLAKLAGWGPAVPDDDLIWSVLEVAWDADAATELWRDHVDEGLPRVADDPPATVGVYGELGDVDWDRQAVAVWYAGESSSCPAYVADVSTDDDEVAVGEHTANAGACRLDWNGYRAVLVVDRDHLPAPDALPIETTEGSAEEGVLAVHLVVTFPGMTGTKSP